MRKTLTAILALLVIVAVSVFGYLRFMPRVSPKPNPASAKVVGNPKSDLIARLYADTGRPWMSDEAGPHGLAPVTGPLASLADNDPLPPQPTKSQLLTLFPELKHEPFNTAGFDALTLPFRYESLDRTGDDAEAMALSFLLSDDLDWAPASYCSRHAFFTYRRSRDKMFSLRQTYEAQNISSLIAFWRTTCAVGGVLRRTADGCTGTLEIYGPDGALLHSADFNTPRPYFQLLGDLSCDAMVYLKSPPSPALRRHLHRDRCQRPESLLRLAAAAELDSRNGGEFHALLRLLDDDPDFAEVRAWVANQREWANDDHGLQLREMLRAQQSRLTPSLGDIDIGRCIDPEVIEQYKTLVNAGEKLVGPDAPVILQSRLQLAAQIHSMPQALYLQSLDACRRYPNNYRFCCDFARHLYYNESSPIDRNIIGSVGVTAYLNRWMDAVGDRSSAKEALADAWVDDKPALAASICDGLEITPAIQMLVFHGLLNSGRYEELMKRIEAAPPLPAAPPAFDSSFALLAAIALNDTDRVAGKAALDWVGQRYKEDLALHGSDKLLAAYNEAITGERADLTFFNRRAMEVRDDAADRVTPWQILLAGDIDVVQHRQQVRNLVWQLVAQNPEFRCAWALWDGYERQSSTALGWTMFHTLKWMHPYDAFLNRAEAGNRSRPATEDDLLQLFEMSVERVKPIEYPVSGGKWDPNMAVAVYKVDTPWAAGADIMRLLASGNRSKAHELAVKFQMYAVFDDNAGLRMFASDLLRRTAERPVQ